MNKKFADYFVNFFPGIIFYLDKSLKILQGYVSSHFKMSARPVTRAAVVHSNLRAGSTFPVPVCAVSPGLWVNKADTQYEWPVQQG